MINETTVYRLEGYRITEYESGFIRWEKLFNFGVQRSGKCFLQNDILIIGNWCCEEAGYLQLEFSEQLKKLPVWDKTRYYCFASELLDISTLQPMSNDFFERYVTLTGTGSKSLMNISPGMFRLGKYQITVTDQGEVLWQTYDGLHRVVGGQCVFESDVLFIGPQEYDEGNHSKGDFITRLNQLPKWDKSIAWCSSLVLRSCQYKKTEDTGSIIHHQYRIDKHYFDEKQPSFYIDQDKDPPKKLFLSDIKWLKTVWHPIREGKKWLKYLISLFVIGLMLGLVLLWHSVEKKSHFSHGNNHHHKHDD